MSYCPKCGSEVSAQDNFCSSCGNLISATKYERFSYAGFWRRFAAIFIDGIIVSGAWTIISKLFGIPSPVDPLSIYDLEYSLGAEQVATIFRLRIVAAVLAWLYYAAFESSKFQATPGKMALGIIVTDYEGERISFGKATGRYFSKIISAIILFIGYIMAAFTEQKQALHDIMAGTLVIKKERVGRA